jgi:hypothetical protein
MWSIGRRRLDRALAFDQPGELVRQRRNFHVETLRRQQSLNDGQPQPDLPLIERPLQDLADLDNDLPATLGRNRPSAANALRQQPQF